MGTRCLDRAPHIGGADVDLAFPVRVAHQPVPLDVGGTEPRTEPQRIVSPVRRQLSRARTARKYCAERTCVHL